MKRYGSIIILIILAALAIYFYLNRQTSTIESDFSNFEIEDTATVDRIFIADYNGKTADLTRQPNSSWKVNGKFKARQDAVELLLKTFKGVKVKDVVPQASIETVIKNMATRSFKVEVYSGGSKPAKVYYVGNATQNHFGTYMLLEIDGKKSGKPYVTHIPGFHGFLTPRFFTEEDKWRDRTVFAYEANDIRYIRINYSEKPLKSFELRKKEGAFEVIDLAQQISVEPLKEEAIYEFLSRFKSIHFEYIQRETPLANIDSVTSTLPIHIIEVEGEDGGRTELKTYYKPVKESMMINPTTGETYTYDLDRLYALINGEDFVVMQWPTLDKILAYNSDFLSTEIVDN